MAEEKAGQDDKLATYRGMRDVARTPEPVPEDTPVPRGDDDTFVIQEHHARRLHWDLRLERDGVLVSWAIPKGIPLDPKTNHLAVHTEDHPLEYATFEGEIPKGEYGAGRMFIWDHGTYETEKWTDREVKVVLHGKRVSGRHVLFQTDDKNWMIRRLDPPADPDAEPLPEGLPPMLQQERKRLPRDQEAYGFEFAWGGRRALAYISGGRAALTGENGEDLSLPTGLGSGLGAALGARPALLDGELAEVAGDEVYMGGSQGKPERGNGLVSEGPGKVTHDRVRWFDHSSVNCVMLDRCGSLRCAGPDSARFGKVPRE